MKKIMIGYEPLRIVVEQIFIKYGFSKKNAAIATKNLINADLRGIDSHGVARLSGYLRLIENGRININAKPKLLRSSPTTARIDADKSLGLIVGTSAMNVAIKKAKKYGSGWVAVGNSSHFGIAANYAMMALAHDMIGIVMTNASAIVAPTFSASRMLGTNPIAIAVPAGDQFPFVADFSTTTTANGKLEIAQMANKKIPKGWALTKTGSFTSNPNILKEGGMLTPLGSNRIMGSHKGYALGSIVDILSGVLSGANFGPWVPPFPAYIPMPQNMPGNGIGHFFGAMSIDAFEEVSDFKKNMDLWITTFRNAVPLKCTQPVLIPGDPERVATEQRLENGIPIAEHIYLEIWNLIKDIELGYRFEKLLIS